MIATPRITLSERTRWTPRRGISRRAIHREARSRVRVRRVVDAMGSIADVMAGLAAADAHIASLPGSYPRDPGDADGKFVPISRRVDLTAESARVRLEQETLMTQLQRGERAARRDRNYYVAPDGSLHDAALVPEPPPASPSPPPKRPRKTHPVGERVRVGDETYSAESRALEWLRKYVVPLLPTESVPTAVFGRGSRSIRRVVDDYDDRRERNASASASSVGFRGARLVITDASGADILPVHLCARETPSSEGVGANPSYDRDRWGRERWTFAGVRECARVEGPCVVLLLALDGEAADPTVDRVDERRAYRAWCVPKEDALRTHDAHKNHVVVALDDASCKWKPYRVGGGRDCADVAAPLAATLARHVDAMVASRGQSLGRAVAPTRVATATVATEPARGSLPASRRRELFERALGLWAAPPRPPPRSRPRDAAADAAAVDDDLAMLRLDYDASVTFAIQRKRGSLASDKDWDVVTAPLTRSGKPGAGRGGVAYRKEDFDALFVDVPSASHAPGCFVIPVNDLVKRRHVLGEYVEPGAGRTHRCDESIVGTNLRLMVPKRASSWRGVRAPYDAKDGCFVDPASAWAKEYFVAYPTGPEDAARAAEEARRLLLGERPSWDGEWTHPIFRRAPLDG